MKFLLVACSLVVLIAVGTSGVETKEISDPTDVQMKPSEGLLHEFGVILHKKLESEINKNQASGKEILMDYHRKNGECERDSDWMEYYDPAAQSCMSCELGNSPYEDCAVYRKRQELDKLRSSAWLTWIPYLIIVVFTAFAVALTVFTYKLNQRVEAAKNQKINKRQQQQASD